MNYNISFSRPYIPTDRAYWRSLIAFNSLLVHPCNGLGPRETHSRRYDRSSFLFHRSPSYRSTLFAHFLPLSLRRSTDIASLSRLLLLLSLCPHPLFFPFRRRDRLTLMQPLIVRGDRREIPGSQSAAARRTYCYRNERPLISDHHRG